MRLYRFQLACYSRGCDAIAALRNLLNESDVFVLNESNAEIFV
jgi:hypothetical protein